MTGAISGLMLLDGSPKRMTEQVFFDNIFEFSFEITFIFFERFRQRLHHNRTLLNRLLVPAANVE